MKFLEDPMQTMGAGFALALVLVVVFLGMAGVGAGDADWVGIIVRWIHFLAGITWIGLLYFFNLINAIGGLLGIIMMANVHAIIWPNQKKIIAAVTASAQGTPAPAEMAQWGRTALLASRVNFLLSIPMLFFMGAGSHFK